MTRAAPPLALVLALGIAGCGPAKRAAPVPAVLDAVPPLFLGRWAVLGTPCRDRAPGRMDVGTDAIRFGAASGAIVRVEEPAPLVVRLTLRGAGTTTLTLSGAGNVLDRDGAASYRRCLAPARSR